jgi:hypothetical protein
MATQLEIDLQSHYAGRFRRIWVATTRYNSVCITVFPAFSDFHNSYRIVTRNKVSNRIDFNYCVKIIDQDLSDWNPLNVARIAMERSSGTEQFLSNLITYIDRLGDECSRQLDQKYSLT